ncbi:MAG: SpoIID/LytB domain-containing protein [Candidatus Limnocylindria bacterium]
MGRGLLDVIVRGTLILVLAAFPALAGTPALAGPGALLSAGYQASPPAEVAAGTRVTVPVILTNTGDETWEPWTDAPAVGTVSLTYHWYDAEGRLVLWDGVRSSIGAPFAPGAQRAVDATVELPQRPGSYFLRFALVKEGLAWFEPSNIYLVRAPSALDATYGQVVVPSFLMATTYQLVVPITNIGTDPWSPAGPNPVRLAYHWHDQNGNTIVWDGVRSELTGDVAPGATVTVNATVQTPETAGTYTLTFDLVREGIGWFQSLGATPPARFQTVVAPATYAAAYAPPPALSAFSGESRTVPVTVTNTGNVPWPAAGPNPVSLSYHLYDESGRLVIWDGPRRQLGTDLAPAESRVFELDLAVPAAVGRYTLVVDAVREGISWFSGIGTPGARVSLSVDSGYNAGYGASTTPTQVTLGAQIDLSVVVTNYQGRVWPAGGASPVRLSYHILRSDGSVAVWDGRRGLLPVDLPPGTSVAVPISVVVPSITGSYVIAWDLVQEGVAWFSDFGVVQKREPITVQPGVTFYGKGFGHGVGMSQYGAQGWATGAAGPVLTGEQIVAHYYAGITLTTIPALDTQGLNRVIRVLLSQPSSSGRFSCGRPHFAGSVANLISGGGFHVLNEGAGNGLVATAPSNVTFQLAAANGVVQVWDQSTVQKVYEGAGPIVLVPIDPGQPIRMEEKGSYRGNLRFTNLGNTLRVINVVNYDDYTRGVIPLEMPHTWHPEAIKAQAYAARTYAFSSYKGSARDFDVHDDQSDQCYGGTTVEQASTSAAVDATAGVVIAYEGKAIRAYFASSNGGYSLSDGCWAGGQVQSGGTWVCGPGSPYLLPVADPADLLVTTPVANPRASWSVSFTGEELRAAVLRCNGVDIGTLRSVDLSNRNPAGVGHVISVRISGSLGSVDLRGDKFLRECLFLRSTMVRVQPF